MVKETTRKCSHCGNNGHNSRTCNEKGCFKLFGVNIAMEKQEQPLKRSVSLGNLEGLQRNDTAYEEAGYLSDGPAHGRKKGKPWTEEEHRTFLAGLEKLGKGNWRGISRNFVVTRTPTQVASHAQKYFLRKQASSDKKKKRRSSVFDMTFGDSVSAPMDNQNLPFVQNPPVSQASIPAPNLPLEERVEVPSPQNTATAQIINRFPQLCLDHPPVNRANVAVAGGVPNYPGISFMQAGVQANWQSRLAARVPWMQHYASPAYPSVPYSTGGYGTRMAAAHPSGIPWPAAFTRNFPQQVEPSSSTIRKEPLELELKLGQQPQSPHGASLSSKATGPISVT